MKPIFLFLISISSANASIAQQPAYTRKHFVRDFDSTEFKVVDPKKGSGLLRTYIQTDVQVMDIDDNNTTYIMGGTKALLCIEGKKLNGKREGIYNVYLIDSIDHKKRYRIWEQNYANDKLNGVWKTYTLKGTLADEQNYKNDSLNGISRKYWIVGKKVMAEAEYFNGSNHFIERRFYKNGKVESEIPYHGREITGTGKKYYETGSIKEIANFKNSEFDGTRKYFYPNGQLWIEQIYKDGKNWTVVGNYTSDGKKRDAGTLKDGNGTLIFYDEDGKVREVLTFENGVEKK